MVAGPEGIAGLRGEVIGCLAVDQKSSFSINGHPVIPNRFVKPHQLPRDPLDLSPLGYLPAVELVANLPKALRGVGEVGLRDAAWDDDAPRDHGLVRRVLEAPLPALVIAHAQEEVEELVVVLAGQHADGLLREMLEDLG